MGVMRTALMVLLAFAAVLLSGCATPSIQSTSYTKVLQPDEEDDIGGTFMESGDIRTVAQRMTTSLLSSNALNSRGSMVRIAIAPVRNETRFIVDKDIFSKRLRIELNKVAEGRIRFFAQGTGQETRREILQAQDREMWDASVDTLASFISNSAVVVDASQPLKVAVIPVKNTNIIGMNADSFTAILRSRMAEKARGKIHFLAREENGKVISQVIAESDLRHLGLAESSRNRSVASVDYFLGGEFIAKSLSTEAAHVSHESRVGVSKDDPREMEVASSTAVVHPNTEIYLNVMLIDAQTGVIPVERMVRVEREMKSGLGNADLLLTGELSALSKGAAGGERSDYIILSFQLIDPQSNEVVWEDSYETKKVSNRSVLYK